jgi:hypothetical protein
MPDIHSRQYISASDVLIDYSTDGNNYYPVPFIGNYNLALEWSGKEFTPALNKFSEDVKLTKKNKLDILIDQSTSFQMPDDCWIKISLFLGELMNGDRLYWARSAKYKQLNKSGRMLIDGVAAIQYQLNSDRTAFSFNEIRYATLFVYFATSYNSPIQSQVSFATSNHLFLLN